jgi:hypothetical protein
MTRYRTTKEELGRVWFTWDGAEIYSFDDGKFFMRTYPLRVELMALGEEVDAAWDRSIATASVEGHTSLGYFQASVDRVLGLKIGAAVASDDPVVRGLTMLDRRAGRNTLMSPSLDSDTHPFVRCLRHIRRQAEGWASADVLA